MIWLDIVCENASLVASLDSISHYSFPEIFRQGRLDGREPVTDHVHIWLLLKKIGGQAMRDTRISLVRVYFAKPFIARQIRGHLQYISSPKTAPLPDCFMR